MEATTTQDTKTEIQAIADKARDTIEQAHENGTLYEWFLDVYETYRVYRRTIDHKGELIGYELLIAYGGPNVYVIDKGGPIAAVKCYWGFEESEPAHLDRDTTNALFDIINDYHELERM